MKNCKNYKIYKFKFAIHGESHKKRLESWKKAQELTEFKMKLINNF